MHLETAAIVVDDYDRAITFFVDALGFELVEDSPAVGTHDGRTKRWVVVRPPGAVTGLLLAEANGPEQEAAVGHQFAGRVGFFLRVDDFDAHHERMRAAGVEFLEAVRTEPYGRVVVFRDVAGNKWDLLGTDPAYRGRMAHEHHFASHLVWQGSTADGYQRYERNHLVRTPPATAELAVSAATAFRGDESLTNPEQLVLAAASSCQLLSFLAVAARAGIDVRGYTDDAAAVMPVTREPMHIATIVLRPHITVGPGTDVEAVLTAVEQGHDECFIANSLRTQITVEPVVTVVR